MKICCAVCLALIIIINISGHVLWSRLPNIILVTIDTVRQDHLGYAGYGRDTSPNMEKLAADGVTFLQATSFSDWTMPSQENLLTGRYPVTAIQDVNRILVPSSRQLLTEILKRYGYQTAAFVSNEWCKRKFGLNQGFDFYDDDFYLLERSITQYYDAILEWLNKKAARPFFLWLHLFEPHFPYEAHDEYVYKPSRPTEFDAYNRYFEDEEEMEKLWHNRMNLKEKDIERGKALYDGEISYIDGYLGRFLDDLKKRGLFDTSMIIVTSDHGEGFGEHGLYFHHGYNITEEITRVPLIIKMSGNSPRGKVIGEQVQTSDIFDTILDVADITNQENILSKSLLPLIRGDGSYLRRYAYSYSAQGRSYSVRDGRFKMICSYRSCEDILEEPIYMLYDLDSDPQETVNVYEDRPEIVQRMRWNLDKFREAFSEFRSEHSKEESPEIDEETRKSLQALGYLH